MKSQKDFRSQDTANEFVRKAAKLEPIKKSGKERHSLYNVKDDDELEEEDYKPKKESIFDYLDEDED